MFPHVRVKTIGNNMQNLFIIFWFFRSHTAKTPTLILLQSMSKDAVPCKNVYFQSYKTKI